MKAHYIERIDELNRNVHNLRRANAVARNHARKDGERMLAEVESLQEENANLCAEIARLQAELADVRDTAERCFAAAMKNAVALADERKRGA